MHYTLYFEKANHLSCVEAGALLCNLKNNNIQYSDVNFLARKHTQRGHQHYLSLAFCWLKQNEAIRRIPLEILKNLMEVNYLQYSYRSCHELHGRGGCSNWSPTSNEICHSAPVVSRCAGWFIAQWYNKPTHEPSVLIWLPIESNFYILLLHIALQCRQTSRSNFLKLLLAALFVSIHFSIIEFWMMFIQKQIYQCIIVTSWTQEEMQWIFPTRCILLAVGIAATIIAGAQNASGRVWPLGWKIWMSMA